MAFLHSLQSPQKGFELAEIQGAQGKTEPVAQAPVPKLFRHNSKRGRKDQSVTLLFQYRDKP